MFLSANKSRTKVRTVTDAQRVANDLAGGSRPLEYWNITFPDGGDPVLVKVELGPAGEEQFVKTTRSLNAGNVQVGSFNTEEAETDKLVREAEEAAAALAAIERKAEAQKVKEAQLVLRNEELKREAEEDGLPFVPETMEDFDGVAAE